MLFLLRIGLIRLIVFGFLISAFLGRLGSISGFECNRYGRHRRYLRKGFESVFPVG